MTILTLIMFCSFLSSATKFFVKLFYNAVDNGTVDMFWDVENKFSPSGFAPNNERDYLIAVTLESEIFFFHSVILVKSPPENDGLFFCAGR